MLNPLFIGFIGCIIKQQKKSGKTKILDFRKLLLKHLKELSEAGQLDEVEWYPALYALWREGLSEAEIETLLAGFTSLVTTVAPSDLECLSVDVRNNLLLEFSPMLNYGIDSFQTTFSVKWSDGMITDYCCRPVTNQKFDITPLFIYDLNKMFYQHLTEFMLRPGGLDSTHDQIAKAFDQEKFNELLVIMHKHVNTLPASSRESYAHIIDRMSHICGEDPPTKLYDESKQKVGLNWLTNGGGF